MTLKMCLKLRWKFWIKPFKLLQIFIFAAFLSQLEMKRKWRDSLVPQTRSNASFCSDPSSAGNPAPVVWSTSWRWWKRLEVKNRLLFFFLSKISPAFKHPRPVPRVWRAFSGVGRNARLRKCNVQQGNGGKF